MRKRFTEKLAEKLADVKNAFGRSKIAKRVATLSLAAGMLLPVAFAASGCQVIIRDPNNPDKDIVVDINPGTNPGDGDNKDPVEPSKEPDYSMYSPTLQTVLKSEYYNDSIELIKSAHYNSNFDGDYNMAEAIPFSFLEKQGENIQQIRDNKIRVIALPYILQEEKNVLYNIIEIIYGNDKDDYIKQYLLKYKITDQEYKELNMLYQGKYYQAQMFVQELDNQRDAELVNKFSISVNTYRSLLGRFNSSSNIAPLFETGLVDNFIITNCEHTEDDCNFISVNLISGVKNSTPVSARQFATAVIRINPQSKTTFENGIMNCKQISMYTMETTPVVPITCFQGGISSTGLNNFIK